MAEDAKEKGLFPGLSIEGIVRLYMDIVQENKD